MSLILRVHKSQAQAYPLVTEEGMGVDQWTHWPASLDDLTRFRPVRDHLQRGTPAEVALQLPHAHPHTTHRRRNEKLQRQS